MSHFAQKSIPVLGDGTDLTVRQLDSRTALAYLDRHGATDVAEALGLTSYLGHDYVATAARRSRTVPAWREGSAE